MVTLQEDDKIICQMREFSCIVKKGFISQGLFLILIFIVVGCSYYSKESYLKDFEKFITDVSQNYKSYDDKVWDKQTKRYEKFTGEWFEKFKSDFTLQENITITSYKVKFNYFKSSTVIHSFLDTLKVDEIKKKAQYYIDNNMEGDLNQLYEEACKIGGVTEKTVTEILEDLHVNIENLKEKYEK